MQTAAYVALSGQAALDQRLSILANNVANAGTVGFKAEGVSFAALVDSGPPLPAAFALHSGMHAVTSSGSLSKTGNPLDVAVQGEGFLALQTPAGTVYTRDGRMQVLSDGSLVSLNGHPILDAGGAPLLVDPAAQITIAHDGMITQNGRQVGAIGLFQVDLSKPYRRYENAGFAPSGAAEPIVTFTGNGVIQGFTEDSNVNAVLEMTDLIKVTRAFEALASALEQNDSAMRSAIQALGAKA